MGAQDKAKNRVQLIKGGTKERVGGATGNKRMRREGTADKMSANLKQAGEKVKDAGKKIRAALG